MHRDPVVAATGHDERPGERLGHLHVGATGDLMGEPGCPQGEWQVAVQERLVGQDAPGKGVEHEGIGRVVSHDRDAERRGIGSAAGPRGRLKVGIHRREGLTGRGAVILHRHPSGRSPCRWDRPDAAGDEDQDSEPGARMNGDGHRRASGRDHDHMMGDGRGKCHCFPLSWSGPGRGVIVHAMPAVPVDSTVSGALPPPQLTAPALPDLPALPPPPCQASARSPRS